VFCSRWIDTMTPPTLLSEMRGCGTRNDDHPIRAQTDVGRADRRKTYRRTDGRIPYPTKIQQGMCLSLRVVCLLIVGLLVVSFQQVDSWSGRHMPYCASSRCLYRIQASRRISFLTTPIRQITPCFGTRASNMASASDSQVRITALKPRRLCPLRIRSLRRCARGIL
jgi:hypothetical protein